MTKKFSNCEECKKKSKRLYKLEDGRKVCYRCKYKILKKEGLLMYKVPKLLSIQEILSKQYDVKCGGNNKYIYGTISVNRALIGHKVKLILVEDNKKLKNGDKE
jgi:hypothetical protein